MALLHRATLTPTKADMLAAWLPHQEWYAGGGPLTVLGAYRFDDPDDQVGIETFLVRAGSGPVLQVPLTYRGAPLEGAEHGLVTEMQHSVLGPRWVYCGCDDPAYAAALVSTVLTGGAQAAQEIEVDGVRKSRETTTFARGSGVPDAVVPTLGPLARREVDGCTVLKSDEAEVTVCRKVTSTPGFDTAGLQTLHGRWPGHSEPTLLAAVGVR